MGAILLEFDVKMGPIFKYAVPSTLEVTQDETMVLFSTRSIVEEGFTGLTVKDRTWATYLKPPYLYCVLLSPMEHQNDFERPMETTLNQIEYETGIDQAKLSEIYHAILSKTENQLKEELALKPEVQQILNTLQSNPNALRPTWSLQTGYRYPEAERITGQTSSETNELLSNMRSTGLLSSRICGNIAICPKCQSQQVLLYATCPKCGLPTLETGIALEHFICDHTAFIEEYSTPSGLICPHCKSYLIPGTYRSPGKVFHCITCNSYPKKPEKTLGCLNCKDTFTPDQAKYIPIYCYTAP